MDALTFKDWIIIAFGAGGILSTVQYLLSVVRELKNKIDRADSRVHNVELGIGKLETKMDGLIDQIRWIEKGQKQQL
jgi:hypothetical protein